jgi:hypothetical protein
LVGGCDIISELHENEELLAALNWSNKGLKEIFISDFIEQV